MLSSDEEEYFSSAIKSSNLENLFQNLDLQPTVDYNSHLIFIAPKQPKKTSESTSVAQNQPTTSQLRLQTNQVINDTISKNTPDINTKNSISKSNDISDSNTNKCIGESSDKYNRDGNDNIDKEFTSKFSLAIPSDKDMAKGKVKQRKQAKPLERTPKANIKNGKIEPPSESSQDKVSSQVPSFRFENTIVTKPHPERKQTVIPVNNVKEEKKNKGLLLVKRAKACLAKKDLVEDDLHTFNVDDFSQYAVFILGGSKLVLQLYQIPDMKKSNFVLNETIEININMNMTISFWVKGQYIQITFENLGDFLECCLILEIKGATLVKNLKKSSDWILLQDPGLESVKIIQYPTDNEWAWWLLNLLPKAVRKVKEDNGKYSEEYLKASLELFNPNLYMFANGEQSPLAAEMLEIIEQLDSGDVPCLYANVPNGDLVSLSLDLKQHHVMTKELHVQTISKMDNISMELSKSLEQHDALKSEQNTFHSLFLGQMSNLESAVSTAIAMCDKRSNVNKDLIDDLNSKNSVLSKCLLDSSNKVGTQLNRIKELEAKVEELEYAASKNQDTLNKSVGKERVETDLMEKLDNYKILFRKLAGIKDILDGKMGEFHADVKKTMNQLYCNILDTIQRESVNDKIGKLIADEVRICTYEIIGRSKGITNSPLGELYKSLQKANESKTN